MYEGKFALFNARYFWSSETHPSIRAWSHLCYVFGGDPGVAVGGRYVPGRRQGDLGDPPPIVVSVYESLCSCKDKSKRGVSHSLDSIGYVVIIIYHVFFCGKAKEDYLIH